MASLLEILKTEYEIEYSMKLWKKPKIYHGGEDYDLSKRWYVYFDYLNPETNTFVRQKPLYFKVNQRFHTKKERMVFLRNLRNALENLLKRGYSPYNHEVDTKSNVSEALDYALAIKKAEVKETTYKDYASRVDILKKWLINNGYKYSHMKEIDKKIINNFLDTIKGAKNRNNTRAALSSVFSVLADADFIETNFIKDIRNKKTVQKAVKTYSKDEIIHITNLLKEQDNTLLMFIFFVSYMFVRPIELTRIKVNDIDLENRLIKLKTKTKEHKVKIIPSIIFDDLKAFIDSKKGFIFNDSVGTEVTKRNYYTRRFLKFRKRNGIDEDLKLYSFRHTYISILYLEIRKELSKEETIKKLSLITGHTSSAIYSYIQVNDLELPEDYSNLLK